MKLIDAKFIRFLPRTIGCGYPNSGPSSEFFEENCPYLEDHIEACCN
jgi:hypothetical protein